MCQNFKQNLVVILTDALDSTVQVIKIVDPTWTGLAQLQTDTAAAIAAINGWTEGTTGQNVIEILNIVEDDISLFPVPPQYQAIIVIAIDGIKSIIVLVDEHSTGTTQVAAAKVMASAKWTPPTVQYEGTRQFAVAFNKALSSHPELASAKIKVPKKWGILP